MEAILRWFELMSGLKIIYEKCEMIRIRTDTNLLNAMANIFGCKVSHLPLK